MDGRELTPAEVVTQALRPWARPPLAATTTEPAVAEKTPKQIVDEALGW